MKVEKDLTHKALVNLILIISTATSLLVSSLFLSNELRGLNQISAHQQNSLEQFAEVVGVHVGRFDYATASDLAKQFSKLEFVKGVLIEDAYRIKVFGENDLVSRAPTGGGLEVYRKALRFNSDGPTNVVGEITVLYPKTNYVLIYGSAALQTLLLFCVVFSSCYGVLTHYIKRYVLEPVARLSAAITETLITGDPVQSDYNSDSVMGRLALNFDTMQAKLHDANLLAKRAQLMQQTQFDGVSQILREVRNAVSYFNEEQKLIYRSDDENWPSAIRQLLQRPVHNQQQAINILSADGAIVLPVNTAANLTDVAAYTLNLETTDGEFWLIAALQLLEGGFGYHVSNVSNLREMEHELSQAKKMEAVGVLSSGIAHEFNNHLAVISGNIELVLTDDKLSSAHRERLVRANSTSQAAVNTVGQLLKYSKQNTQTQMGGVDIRELLEDVKEKAAVFLGANATLRYKIEKNFRFMVNRSGLESALLNLIKNASEEIVGEGHISIRARSMTNTEKHEKGHKFSDAQIAVLDVIDDGLPVPKPLQTKLFDPFFTNKPTGKGVGLGLWTVQRFTTQFGGEVIHREIEPTGNRFSMFLPIGEAGVTKPIPILSSEVEAPFNGETVFLLEDEKYLFDLTQEYLEQAGAQVIGATSIHSARKLLRKPDPIDIALCDLHLPDGHGTEICSLIKSKQKQSLTVILSGNLELTEDEKRDVDILAQKPVKYRDFFSMLAKRSMENSRSSRLSH